jgi:hypothetical protein
VLTLTTILVVVVLPVTGLAAVLFLVARGERARHAQVARQIGVTDAIHRELGAVVAPVVKRGMAGGWRVEIAVPFEAPALIGRVVALAHAAMSSTGASPVEVVLTAQEARVTPLDVRRRRPAGTSPLAAGEEEVIAWTGPTASRAS